MNRAIYRIIDANFNRAREACRVIEEFCRFVLNSQILTQRTKQLRHQLCSVINTIDSHLLLAARDSRGDVGAGRTIENQMRRKNPVDCLVAACKRLSEALRVLAEMIGGFDTHGAGKIEQLRFEAYELEKDISLFFDTAGRFKTVRLYIVITSDLPADIIRLVHSCIAGGVDCIQLRAKQMATGSLFAVAREFVDICKEHNVLSIINDRVDIAVAAQADGVHLGKTDMPIEQARKLQQRPLIIGCTTHSPAELQQAMQAMPTYVSLGPVFATPTKPELQPVGLEYVKKGLELLKDTGIGHVAIGGITSQNVSKVLSAGASTIAVCSAVTGSSDPTAATRKLKEQITHFLKELT